MLEQLENSTEDFKKSFLLKFTKELIKNSIPELKFQIELREKFPMKTPSLIQSQQPVKVYEKPATMPISSQVKIKPSFKPLPKSFKLLEMPERLKIPQTRLPQHLRYIKPEITPTKIDLGKLNPLINNPMIKTIECNGPNQRIIIRDTSEKQTKIILTKKEIDEILEKFAKTAKIPIVSEGIFRVAVGRLVLSAIISKVIPSKFIIKKIKPSPVSMTRRQPPRMLMPQKRIPFQRRMPLKQEIFPRKIL